MRWACRWWGFGFAHTLEAVHVLKWACLNLLTDTLLSVPMSSISTLSSSSVWPLMSPKRRCTGTLTAATTVDSCWLTAAEPSTTVQKSRSGTSALTTCVMTVAAVGAQTGREGVCRARVSQEQQQPCPHTAISPGAAGSCRLCDCLGMAASSTAPFARLLHDPQGGGGGV